MPAALPCSAAAERNKQPILDQLRRFLPADAEVLEIASGTGQHVAHFAVGLPRSSWQPTDADASNLVTIAAHCDALALHNVHAPRLLDVHEPGWCVPDHFDAVVGINLIHIAPWSATAALFAGAARVLRADGPRLLFLYGPYKEGGRHTAPTNESFDASLRARDAAWGVRDLEAVTDVARQHGFRQLDLARLPANNLLLTFTA